MGERVARKRQASAPEVGEKMRRQGVLGGHGVAADLGPDNGKNFLRHYNRH